MPGDILDEKSWESLVQIDRKIDRETDQNHRVRTNINLNKLPPSLEGGLNTKPKLHSSRNSNSSDTKREKKDTLLFPSSSDPI